MYELESRINGLEMTEKELEQRLKPLGFDMGGNWEYDHGYMDYKMDEDDDHGYQFLRIPFFATEGEVGSDKTKVVLGTPFLLSHRYEAGIAEEANPVFSALWNQFASPEEKDAYVEDQYVQEGKNLIREVEQALLV
ncbi:YugN family protein [Natribacillus halophilus]|uniref:YugN-like family protein n=1 Tax=Natribacillus halophilus TaxID=549003 RepID=A0A1G8MLI9_9BACI|nr:YugN family protein [Natribacillus halophilus]SDI68705.1 YugN-like family protein [Natribacillus halophilus]